VDGAALLRDLLTHLAPHSASNRIQVTVLAGANLDLPASLTDALVAAHWTLTQGAATLDNLQRLAEACDLLYLTAHGRRDRLLLESDGGATVEMTTADLVDRFSGARRKPHLLFLAACFSAQRLDPAAPPAADDDAFTAVGPALHAAGIPAVVAMQSGVTIDAAQRVAADFFAALFDPELADGGVDRALNRARRLLYERQTPLWAPPVLYCRLQDGLLYAPPPLLGADGPPTPAPTIIPTPRTGLLVARDADLAWLRQRLLTGNASALVGVQGLGGIGKTELAIAAAQALANDFPGGVFWLECGANEIPAVQQRLADALGIRLTSPDPKTRADQLVAALQLRPSSLVVLDDVRRPHADKFELLRPPTPPCALLVTSRRSDLPLPPAAIRSLETLTQAQAATLLHFLLAEAGLDGDAATIDAIAKLLDLPLAVKLAGRRAVLLAQRRSRGAPPAAPLTRLLTELRQSRLAAIELAGGDPRPDLSARATFTLSYDDLTPIDQEALRALGVLARNEFTLATAAALWAQTPAAAADTARRLANAGLIEELADDLWDSLWELHDLLREYAGERLRSDAATWQTAQRRHAHLVMATLDVMALRTIDDWRRLAFWQPEAAQAAAWVATCSDAALSVDFFLTLAQNYPNHTFPALGQWLERCALPAAQQRGQLESVHRVQRKLGEFWQYHGEAARGEVFLRASLHTAETLLAAAPDDDARATATWSVAVTQSSMADLLSTRGQYDEAERLYRESLRVFEAVGDSRSVAVTQS
ncbi:MAG TPA: hypothetical protein DCL15_08040, partial [Chloroflexi bacterium]|nr:hypothetical protein [Chloroflexota bacterium]